VTNFPGARSCGKFQRPFLSQKRWCFIRIRHFPEKLSRPSAAKIIAELKAEGLFLDDHVVRRALEQIGEQVFFVFT
jgi:hypothetical protein